MCTLDSRSGVPAHTQVRALGPPGVMRIQCESRRFKEIAKRHGEPVEGTQFQRPNP